MQPDPQTFLADLPDLNSLLEAFDPENRESEQTALTQLYEFTKTMVDKEEILKIELNETFDHYLMYSPGAIYQAGKLSAIARETEAILQQEVREITARVKDAQRVELQSALLEAQRIQDLKKIELDEAKAFAQLEARRTLTLAGGKTTEGIIDDTATLYEEVKAAKRAHLDAVQIVRLLDSQLTSQASNLLLNEEIVKANRAHAEAIKLDKLMSALYEAVQKRHELMYGMQRRMNDIASADNRY